MPQRFDYEGIEYESDLYFSLVFINENSILSVSIDSSRMSGVSPAIWVRYQSANNELTSSVESSSDLSEIPDGKQLGEIIQFGSYEQDGDESNGKEPIDWILADKKDDSLLLVSQFPIDLKAYHSGNEEVTWEDSGIRSWLNNEFLTTSFTEDQLKIIKQTEVSTPDLEMENNIFRGGNTVKDRCFILSYEELNKYLSRDKWMIGNPSWNYSNEYEFLLLRSGSLSLTINETYSISISGGNNHVVPAEPEQIYIPAINNSNNLIYVISNRHDLQIRPAIWVSTEKRNVNQ